MTAPFYKGTWQFTVDVTSPYPTWFDSSGRAVNCPYILGGNSIHYWTEIEATEGVRDWTAIDDDITAWGGKKTIIRVSHSDQAAWGDTSTNIGTYGGVANCHSGTPMWLYNNYGVTPLLESSVAAFDTLIPPCWNQTFQTKYSAFITALAAKYDGNPNVFAIQIGIGNGGETLVDQNTGSGASLGNPLVSVDQNRRNICYAAGYTDPVWWTYLQWIVNTYRTAFVQTPLIVLCDLLPFLGNLSSGIATNDGTNTYVRQLLLNWTDTLTNPGVYNQTDKLTNTLTLNGYWYNNGAHKPLGLIAEQYNAAIAANRTLLGDLQNGITILQSIYTLLYGSDIYDANLAVPGQPGGLVPSATSAASLAALQWAQNTITSHQSGMNSRGPAVSGGVSGASYSGASPLKYTATEGGIP